jgi:hypothetical protein
MGREISYPADTPVRGVEVRGSLRGDREGGGPGGEKLAPEIGSIRRNHRFWKRGWSRRTRRRNEGGKEA